jgi:hypothetical protein
MRICFTLDDVIRAKTVQIGRVYKKYINPEIDLDLLDFSTNNYADIFNFADRREWNNFLYKDYPYEIFGEAPVTNKGVDKDFNLWHLGLENFEDIDEKIEVIIANPFEFNTSIGYTNFFLSKMATRVREFYFPLDSSTIWDKCDVLVTSDPKLINEKPDGKVCVKIDMPYNKDCESDLSYESLKEALSDSEFTKKMVDKYV